LSWWCCGVLAALVAAGGWAAVAAAAGLRNLAVKGSRHSSTKVGTSVIKSALKKHMNASGCSLLTCMLQGRLQDSCCLLLLGAGLQVAAMSACRPSRADMLITYQYFDLAELLAGCFHHQQPEQQPLPPRTCSCSICRMQVVPGVKNITIRLLHITRDNRLTRR
jgi:hypothetical protein